MESRDLRFACSGRLYRCEQTADPSTPVRKSGAPPLRMTIRFRVGAYSPRLPLIRPARRDQLSSGDDLPRRRLPGKLRNPVATCCRRGRRRSPPAAARPATSPESEDQAQQDRHDQRCPDGHARGAPHDERLQHQAVNDDDRRRTESARTASRSKPSVNSAATAGPKNAITGPELRNELEARGDHRPERRERHMQIPQPGPPQRAHGKRVVTLRDEPAAQRVGGDVHMAGEIAFSCWMRAAQIAANPMLHSKTALSI